MAKMRMMISLITLLPFFCDSLDVAGMRKLGARNNVTCILVFGDSSVDPGTNNVLNTTMKGNFLPYGKDFLNCHPTGRLSNGRLPTDFIADAVGYTKAIPAYLDPNLKPADLPRVLALHQLLPVMTTTLLIFRMCYLYPDVQLKNFRRYKLNLTRLLDKKTAQDIIKNAVIVMSMGTNDFIQNYYLEPNRPKQFTLEQYQDYLVSCMAHSIQTMHKLGGARLILVGVPPLGCMPLVKTLKGQIKCVEDYNKVSISFNSNIQKKLEDITRTSGMKIAFIDAYGIIQSAINSPQLYGIIETSKGCCGTGAIEFGESCRGLKTCSDPEKYVFWDAVHPTEKMYEIVAEKALQSLGEKILV